MGKVRGFVILVVLLWLAGAIGYRGTAAQKLQAMLAKQYGPGVVVEKVSYNETYGLANFRRGEAIFSVPVPKVDPRSPRGFVARKFAMVVDTQGRWWPREVGHGHPRMLEEEKSPP